MNSQEYIEVTVKITPFSEENAENDACKIEHDLSPESFEALKRHINSGAGK